MSNENVVPSSLEAAEVAYLIARGWRAPPGWGLWTDPLDSKRTHIARVAAYKQRQRDQAAKNKADGT